MAGIFEMLMVLFFGVSWPTSLLRSWKARTSKGKSIIFLFFIWIGYICGIAGKLLTGGVNYVLTFYILNLCMVSADILLYFHNIRYDRREKIGASCRNNEAPTRS